MNVARITALLAALLLSALALPAIAYDAPAPHATHVDEEAPLVPPHPMPATPPAPNNHGLPPPRN
ncbi:MAG: hypothetical protein WD118_05215 [Phycisphaeraceae bacterium]